MTDNLPVKSEFLVYQIEYGISYKLKSKEKGKLNARLNRIVVMWIDYAEDQAKRRKQVS